ncbi:hypothetical protein T03_15563, partial [Trichinella britovi]
LQRVSRSHGLHWRTVVLGWALPARALCARAAPCVHVTTHPVPVESAPDSTSFRSAHGTSVCLAPSSAVSPRRCRQMRPSSSTQLRRCCHSTCMSQLHSG